MACGQSFSAVRSGMAECTPNLRASYDAAETTPRSPRCPPTTTALPFRDGSNSSSTETKKASMSTWKMVLARDISTENSTTGRSDGKLEPDGLQGKPGAAGMSSNLCYRPLLLGRLGLPG